MAKTVKIDADIWDAIVAHYSVLKEPTDVDRRVIAYMCDKLDRQMRRDDFKDAQARYARMNEYKNGEG